MKNGFTLLVKKIKACIRTAASANDEAKWYWLTTKKDQADKVQTGAVVRSLTSSFIKNNEQQKNNSREEQVKVNDDPETTRHQQAPVHNLDSYRNFPQRDEND